MNTQSIRVPPQFSSIMINLKRSLFEIEVLLNLRPKELAKIIAGTAVPATRWNE
jgi:hypothetical protein